MPCVVEYIQVFEKCYYTNEQLINIVCILHIKLFLMKKFLLFFGVIVSSLSAFSQVLSWSPDFIQETFTAITLTMIASEANNGLIGQTSTTDVYVNIAFIKRLSASPSDLKYTTLDWVSTKVSAQCMSLGSNRWSYTVTGRLRNFFAL